jgi:hypothetical protein
MASAFVAAACDEAIAYVSDEALNSGKSPEGSTPRSCSRT